MATYTQRGDKLVSNITVPPFDRGGQGSGVAISTDGEVVVVGSGGAGGFDDYLDGEVIIWVKEGEDWVETQRISSPVPGAQFGDSVAVSADGATIAIGGHSADDEGAVWVYLLDTGTWNLQEKLTQGAVALGAEVDLSADGDTLVAGGPGASDDAGAAYVYQRTGTDWDLQATLVGDPAISQDPEDHAGTRQGSAVAISGDGLTIAVAGTGSPVSNQIGYLWIWAFDGVDWAEQYSRDRLFASRGMGFSYDGNLMLEAWLDSGATSGVAVYERVVDSWSEITSLDVGFRPERVSVSADGLVAAVGYPTEDDQSGVLRIFQQGEGPGDWSNSGPLTPSDWTGPTEPDNKIRVGDAVDVSPDGQFIAVGAPWDDLVNPPSTLAGVGAAWVWASGDVTGLVTVAASIKVPRT